MHALASLLALVVAALPGAAPPATAKVRLPPARVAGKALVATVTVRPATAPRPHVTFSSGARRVPAVVRSAGRRGAYRAGAVLPSPGRWRYDVRFGRRVAARGSFTVAADRPVSRVSGATALRACAASGAFWPTQALAVAAGSAWMACKERGTVERRDARTGALRATIQVPGETPIAVESALGSIWVLGNTQGTIVRIDPATNRVAGRLVLGRARMYNLWFGAGALWSADDASGELVRIDPGALSVTRRIAVGDGPSDLVFDGSTGWAINHRDRRLVRFDGVSGAATLLAALPGDTPERITLAAGSLWLTGRGVDLMRVDPVTGGVISTTEIGGGGIDLIAQAGSIWVPVRPDDDSRSGLPGMETLKRVDLATGTVRTVATATGSVDVHGLTGDGTAVWLADGTNGILYRVAG
jgi:streptogramin lyase